MEIALLRALVRRGEVVTDAAVLGVKASRFVRAHNMEPDEPSPQYDTLSSDLEITLDHSRLESLEHFIDLGVVIPQS